jgi:predicted alpha/beta superfamily hydrolase
VCVSVSVCVSTWVPQHTCGNQRVTFRHPLWVLGIKQVFSLLGTWFYSLSQLAGPRVVTGGGSSIKSWELEGLLSCYTSYGYEKVVAKSPNPSPRTTGLSYHFLHTMVPRVLYPAQLFIEHEFRVWTLSDYSFNLTSPNLYWSQMSSTKIRESPRPRKMQSILCVYRDSGNRQSEIGIKHAHISDIFWSLGHC